MRRRTVPSALCGVQHSRGKPSGLRAADLHLRSPYTQPCRLERIYYANLKSARADLTCRPALGCSRELRGRSYSLVAAQRTV